jgi:hypothetical protein
MKHLVLIISFCFKFLLPCDGQETTAKFEGASNSADSITHINPGVCMAGKSIFKRLPNKAGNKALKLSLWAGKLYVINAKGDVKPYVVKSCDLLIPVNGGTESLKVRGVLNPMTKEVLENTRVGWKFCFQNIVLEDGSGKAMTGLVEPLTMVKIK